MTTAQKRIHDEMRAARGRTMMLDNATTCIDDNGAVIEPNRAPLMSVAPDCGTMPGLIRDRGAMFYTFAQ